MTYLGGDQPSSTKEGQKHFAKFMDWRSSLDEAAIGPANPLKDTCTVNSVGSVTDSGTTSMSGFTIVEADSMEVALKMAKSCPFLDVNGTLEVS